ncbi:uncharacterized protein BT62DRAFT_731197 [Guyanagaster necrorhizus]|uniref:MYND-type domain-containing protein n=1 Tax=Guyanagaster necrorhizus TaxID=856835 RepID=A0A9P7VXR4_9AGAR|nr:uncharacterized protein BT62DRAFT_731197 [Guyanagaster necrorhizus MCA 3950]KAG7448862.1 hypothetical protein BT62DRAFT_731197 [Guyanagaster necrorhizus MCA 3950]
MSDGFVLNRLMFCMEHGNELCNKCYCDHRMCNNMIAESRMEGISGAAKRLVTDENRKPISDVFALGAVKSGEKDADGYTFYKCKIHDTIDCPDCFDWIKIIVAQSKKKDKGKVEDRSQILGLLKSMGIDLPPTLKLPDDALEKKLASALSAAQEISTLGKFPINPSKLPRWENQPKSAFDAMQRTSMAEAVKNFNARTRGLPDPFALYSSAFLDARQTLRHLCRNLETGMDINVLQDKDHNEVICIRVLDIYKLNDTTPLISLIYETASISTPINTTIDFVQTVISKGRNGGPPGLPQITCTPEEQALLRKLLFQNSQRLVSEYMPHKERYERTFKTSFLLPLGPLDQITIGKLSSNLGCEVCGEKTTSRCSQCQSVSYCGPTCQKAHWKDHKNFCRSLKGGNWIQFHFVTAMKDINGKKLYTSYVNNQGRMNPTTVTPDDDAPPSNVHGDKPFLIKIQKPLTRLPGLAISEDAIVPPSLLIYDRQRSFRAHAIEVDNPQAYPMAIREVLMGQTKVKIYRWAKRVGDFELSVCLDRAPDPEPTW